MSQDMMQALSGSSLLSLSVGTLPAVKSGMMLDANPFASQLALMTGPDAAAAAAVGPGTASGGVAESGFAAALAQVPAPEAQGLPAAAVEAAPIAGVAQIAALPEDASPSQIIEAAMHGAIAAATPATAAPMVAQPVILEETPVAGPVPAESGNPIQLAGEAPQLRKLAPKALPATVSADEIAAGPRATETATAEDPVAGLHDTDTPLARPRRLARADAPVATPAEAVPLAAPAIEAAAPVPVRPQADAPDSGNVRVAASSGFAAVADPAPAAEKAPAPAGVAPGTNPGLPTSIQPPLPQTGSMPDVAKLPQPVPASMPMPMAPQGDTAEQVQLADQAPADPPVRSTSAARPHLAEPIQQKAGRPSPVTPQAQAAEASAAFPSAPALREAQGDMAGSLAQAPAAGLEQATEPRGLTGLQTPATPVVADADVMPSTRPVSGLTVSPQDTTRPASPTIAAPQAIAEQVAAPEPALAPAEAAASAAIVLPGQLSAARAAAPVARNAASPIGHRAIQPALQAARPAQALSALFDLPDPAAAPDIDSFRAASGLDGFAPVPADAIPPAWAAALNAVTAPAATGFAQLAGAAAQPAGAQEAHLETLAFDAGFVGNVETQIARVAGGGQLVRMQISPEHLGRIDIEMLAGPDRDHVRIITEHDAVRDTLVQSQVRLEQDLRGQGSRTTDVTVELRQQQAGTSTNMGGGSAQQRGQSGSEAGAAREAAQRQAAAEATTEPKSAQRRPRDNVRYA